MSQEPDQAAAISPAIAQPLQPLEQRLLALEGSIDQIKTISLASAAAADEPKAEAGAEIDGSAGEGGGASESQPSPTPAEAAPTGGAVQ